jgi:hypothetical protein
MSLSNGDEAILLLKSAIKARLSISLRFMDNNRAADLLY